MLPPVYHCCCPPALPSSSPTPQLLFLTPHPPVMADGYKNWNRLQGIGVLQTKGTPGQAAGGREIIQGFCRGWTAAQRPCLPSFLPGSLTGSVLESVSLKTGLLQTENRVNTAARSDHSIFPHRESDRFT